MLMAEERNQGRQTCVASKSHLHFIWFLEGATKRRNRGGLKSALRKGSYAPRRRQSHSDLQERGGGKDKQAFDVNDVPDLGVGEILSTLTLLYQTVFLFF